jgi:hypothetical protein
MPSCLSIGWAGNFSRGGWEVWDEWAEWGLRRHETLSDGGAGPGGFYLEPSITAPPPSFLLYFWNQ